MPRNSSWEAEARAADERIRNAKDMGEQLSLLPEPDAGDGPDAATPARRGPGKANSTLREWLSLRGMRMPEDVLAELAGLDSGQDAVLTAMAKAEQLVAWQFDGAKRILPNGNEVDAVPTAAARMDAFKTILATMLRAADALAPYGLAKVTADVSVQQSTTIVMPSAAPSGQGNGIDARVINGRRTTPPPMPGEIVDNQDVTDLGDA